MKLICIYINFYMSQNWQQNNNTCSYAGNHLPKMFTKSDEKFTYFLFSAVRCNNYLITLLLVIF